MVDMVKFRNLNKKEVGNLVKLGRWNVFQACSSSLLGSIFTGESGLDLGPRKPEKLKFRQIMMNIELL